MRWEELESWRVEVRIKLKLSRIALLAALRAGYLPTLSSMVSMYVDVDAFNHLFIVVSLIMPYVPASDTRSVSSFRELSSTSS